MAFAGFSILDKIGRGGFATVYRCERSHDREMFAIKLISKTSEKFDIKLFNREKKILTKLKHQNVLKLEKTFSSQNFEYLVLELCPNGTLLDKLNTSNNGRFDENLAKNYFGQLLCGLNYIHNVNVIHRDLKPENVLFNSQNVLKIADFGLSRVDDGNLMTTYCGSPQYAAPELLTGRPYFGKGVDIWASGVIFYVMVTGKFPYKSNKVMEQVDSQLNRKLSYPADIVISGLIKQFLIYLLNPDTSDRPKCKDILNNHWQWLYDIEIIV